MIGAQTDRSTGNTSQDPGEAPGPTIHREAVVWGAGITVAHCSKKANNNYKYWGGLPMSFVTTRRGFLGGAAAGLTALAAADAGAAGGAVIENESAGFKLGVATYSFREFQRGLAIKMLKELQTPYVSVNEFHLPYCSTPQELAQGRKNFESAGLKIMSGGNVSLEKADETEMRKYFEYAKA